MPFNIHLIYLLQDLTCKDMTCDFTHEKCLISYLHILILKTTVPNLKYFTLNLKILHLLVKEKRKKK